MFRHKKNNPERLWKAFGAGIIIYLAAVGLDQLYRDYREILRERVNDDVTD